MEPGRPAVARKQDDKGSVGLVRRRVCVRGRFGLEDYNRLCGFQMVASSR